GHGENVRRILIEPDGAQSDLMGALREVSELLRYQPVQSIILFSDGRQVAGESTAASSRSMGSGGGAKVYTVSPAPSGKGAAVVDVAIDRLSLPRSLFVGETLNVLVDVRWTGRGNEP